MGKVKFKTYKRIMEEYEEEFDFDYSDDYTHLVNSVTSDKKFDKSFKEAKEYIKDFRDNTKTVVVKLSLFQKVMKYHMPRKRHLGLYTPYIADYHKLINTVTKAFRDEYQLLGLPAKITVTSYFKIPKNMRLTDKILAVIGFNKPISTPDTDNIIKFYTDIIKRNILFDDDLIYDSRSRKRYSFKPRVDIEIRILTNHTSEFNLKGFLKRKSVKDAIDLGILNVDYLKGVKDKKQ